MINNILKAWNVGLVRRWHTQPELCDTVDYDSGHQQRCTILLLLFWPDSTRDAIIDVITHDQGEDDAGDMARPAKKNNPTIRELLESVELASIREQGFNFHNITELEFHRRKFVDLLDSYVWMLRNKSQMTRKVEWMVQLESLYTQAKALKVSYVFDQYIQSAISFYDPH